MVCNFEKQNSKYGNVEELSDSLALASFDNLNIFVANLIG